MVEQNPAALRRNFIRNLMARNLEDIRLAPRPLPPPTRNDNDEDGSVFRARPLVRAPLRSAVFTEFPGDEVKDPEVEFAELMKAHGFVVTHFTIQQARNHFRARSDNREVELCGEMGLAVGEADEVGRPGSYFVGRDWLGALVRSGPELRFHPFLFNLTATDATLANLVIALHPLQGSPRPGRISIDTLKEIAPLVYQLNFAAPVKDVLTAYLADAVEITIGDKLLLASLTGNELLLESALSLQSGKKESIEEIVQDKPLYAQITNGLKGSSVVARMLEHKCEVEKASYASNCYENYLKLKASIRESFPTLLDFSSENSWSAHLDDGERRYRSNNDVFRLTLGEESFFPSRWWMSAWSPFFDRLLHGGFRESHSQMPTVSVSVSSLLHLGPVAREGVEEGENEISREGLVRFLSLLHPTHIMFLWYLLPSENVLLYPARNEALEALWRVLFSSNLDIAIEVFRLAHKFQVGALQELCLLLMEVNSELSIREQLVLADSYHLPTLMARCLNRLNSPRAIKRVMEDEESGSLMSDLSCPTHSMLFKRLLNLT